MPQPEAQLLWQAADLRRMTVSESGEVLTLTAEQWHRIPFSRLHRIDSKTGAARQLAKFWLIKPTAIAWSEEHRCCAIAYNGLLLPSTTSVGGLLLARLSPQLALVLQLKFLIQLLAGWGAILALILESLLASITTPGSVRKRVRFLIEDFQRRASEKLNNRGFGRYWSWPTFVQIESPYDNGSPPRLLVATATGLFQGIWGQYPHQFEEIQCGLMNCVHFSSVAAKPDEFLVCEGYLHYPNLYSQGRGLGAIWRWKRKENSWTLVRGFLAGASAATHAPDDDSAFVFIASVGGGVSTAWRCGGGQAPPILLAGLNQPEQVETLPDGSLLVRDRDGLKRLTFSAPTQ